MEEKKSIISFIEQEEKFNDEHDRLITKIVTPYLIRIMGDSNREYNEKFYSLSGAKKILIDSLIIKALFYKKQGSFKTEAVKPKDFSENKLLNVSSDIAAKVFNRELKKIFKRTKDGYIIPNIRIKMIGENFFKNE